MKTVLQELIEELNREIDNCERNGLQYRGIYLDARWKAENLLEKEKQQIIEAVQHGLWNNEVVDLDNYSKIYYDSTFGDSN